MTDPTPQTTPTRDEVVLLRARKRAELLSEMQALIALGPYQGYAAERIMQCMKSAVELLSVLPNSFSENERLRTEVDRLTKERDEARQSWREATDAEVGGAHRSFAPAPAPASGRVDAVERLEDKIEGLEADLASAVEVAFRRGAAEWTRLNYPALYVRLNAASLSPAATSGSEAEPVAWLKEWSDDTGKDCRRVDLSHSCEPWLLDMMPTITALVPRKPASPAGVRVDEKVLRGIIARWDCRREYLNTNPSAKDIWIAQEIAALSQPTSAAEPVAWRYEHPDYAIGFGTAALTNADMAAGWKQTPLYTTPPAPAAVDGQRVKVKPLRWIESPRLGGGVRLIAMDCFGNEFTRLDIRQQTSDEIATFKDERQADYEERIRSSLASTDATEG